jgi:lipoxygenase
MTNAETDPAAPPKIVPLPPPPTDIVGQMPIQELGLKNCPAIPFWAVADGDPDLAQVQNTIALLQQRGEQAAAAYAGLDTDFTIDGQTLQAAQFLYGPPVEATKLPLEDATQFALSWTTHQKVYQDSQTLLPVFAGTLDPKDSAPATKTFWPLIANFGLPLNLLVLEKVDSDRLADLRERFGDDWVDDEMRSLQADGLLYGIDTAILESVGSFTAGDGTTRFTPATYTVLEQNPTSKALTPTKIRVWTDGTGVKPVTYVPGDNAWLWALQAAKTSITVWGIWLGHVYHWHTTTAAMQMTMFNTLPASNGLWSLLRRQSQSVINFNYVLLTEVWNTITPPTGVKDYVSLLKLLDTFAGQGGPSGKPRGFFDDDPIAELTARGLTSKDFTPANGKDWAGYPIVRFMLNIWKSTNAFVTVVVDEVYQSDQDVANDGGLKAWITASADPTKGNIKGLSPLTSRADLVKLLTSLLYRVNVHGASGLNPSVNPGLSFVANFPPCLQSAEIPAKDDKPDLMEVLPYTGAIGQMAKFVYTFAYSPPYVALIPENALLDPWFPQSPKSDAALAAFRQNIRQFIDSYRTNWNDELARLRGVKPGSPPGYAAGGYEQWAASIEI